MPTDQTKEGKPEVQKSTLDNTKYNTTREELKKFEADYKNKYGKAYRYSSEEKLLLNNASKDFIKSIKYIFDYTKEHTESGDLEETFVPRIIFFLKVDFRQMQLIEYANNEEHEKEESEKNAQRAEVYLSEERSFFRLLLDKHQTISTLTEYLKSINNRNWLYFHNGSFNLDVLKEVTPIVEAMES